MKIRSITCFSDPGWPVDLMRLERLSRFVISARPAFEAAGYDVQTARLATTPLAGALSTLERGEALQLAVGLESRCKELGFEYLSFGPVLPPTHLEAVPELLDAFDLIVPILAATQNVFLAGMMVDGRGISLEAVRGCAQVIHQAAWVTPDGFTNLRFAALANVLPGTPFLPAAYHQGGAPSFALATESADLAVEAMEGAANFGEARARLVSRVESHAAQLSRIASELSRTSGIDFGGIDFTLAPFPAELSSIGTAIERLGVPAVGLHGSLAAAAFLVEALDRARFKRAGFNGLFLPVLEDFTLARRAGEGQLGVKDLLLYSTVCGTGLDTLPLPGDVSVEQLYAVLLDVAALSLRLNKPLTARLMPVPGKGAGETTDFDFPYFANSRVLALEAQPLGGLLAEGGTLDLHPRGSPAI